MPFEPFGTDLADDRVARSLLARVGRPSPSFEHAPTALPGGSTTFGAGARRPPGSVAREMALWTRAAGGRAVFRLEDDDLVVPRADDGAARVRAILDSFGDYGAGEVALVGACRPEAITQPLARELASLGVIRLDLAAGRSGVEGHAAVVGEPQLCRLRDALAAGRHAGIFCSYDLLLFEPAGSLRLVRQKVSFLREHPDHPTDLFGGELRGPSGLRDGRRAPGSTSPAGPPEPSPACGANARYDLLVELCSAAFREHRASSEAVGLAYSAKVLQFFHGESPGAHTLAAGARALARTVVLELADLLEGALDLAEGLDLHDPATVSREGAEFSRRASALDGRWRSAIDAWQREVRAFVASSPRASLRS